MWGVSQHNTSQVCQFEGLPEFGSDLLDPLEQLLGAFLGAASGVDEGRHVESEEEIDAAGKLGEDVAGNAVDADVRVGDKLFNWGEQGHVEGRGESRAGWTE